MTNTYSFIDVLSKEIVTDNGNILLSKILIPIIQRDYAQGRREPDVNRIRKRFLQSLYDAFEKEPIILDFIYGNIDSEGVMTPLDGQQRLTTLFLLHWYASKKENIEDFKCDFLNKFSYETRYSAREFCKNILNFKPMFNDLLSNEIINQPWFPLDWKKDPTIDSMLTMIDEIDEKFNEVENMWEKLNNNIITFYFLPIQDMGLTDDIYIKMNSRGKPLTIFENFKAELEQEMSQVNKELCSTTISKIDRSWTDVLWVYKDEKNTVDSAFLHFFKFVCDIISIKNDGTLNNDEDVMNLIKKYFSTDNNKAMENIEILNEYFDIFDKIRKNTKIEDYFNNYISINHEKNKIKIDTKYSIDIFKDCLINYGDFNGSIRKFTLGRLILLYAFIIYELNKVNIEEQVFRRRIRIINNLINNSEDEISIRNGNNRIPVILKQTEIIIINGIIPIDGEFGFNSRQLLEEKEKLEWTEKNPDKSELLFELEDNDYLYGQISVLGVEKDYLFTKFEKLLGCDLDKVNCALLSIDNYGLYEKFGDKEIYRFGTSGSSKKETWRRIFHGINNKNFSNTKRVISKLLDTEYIDDDYLQTRINKFISFCENDNYYDWRYYYIKYGEYFRPNKYGNYFWYSYENSPYNMSIMVTSSKPSQYSYQGFLKAIDKNNCISPEHMGQKIVRSDIIIEADNNSYKIYKNSNEKELLDEIIINQNADGIDTEDRILKAQEFFKNKYNN